MLLRRKFGVFVLLALLGSLIVPAVQALQPQGAFSGQLRAFWVDAWNDGFKTPDQIAQLVRDAQTAHANALFVQVRRRGDAYYNESIEPRAADSRLAPEPFDPLAWLIQAAHRADPPLQVHAWVVVMPVWAPNYSTTDPNRHVYYRHGCGNGCSWEDPNNWMTYRYNGGNPVPDYQLDPGHPAAAQYTVDVLLYLVRHYDIDGLHLDYIRYYGADYGYNRVSVDRFRAAYGGSGLPDPADEQWKAWRREQVTTLVRRIYLEALSVKPDLVVSAATIAWGDGPNQTGWENTSAYRSVFQDWRAWLEEGILDLAVPMNYDREHDPTQRLYFEHWIEWEKDHAYGRGVVIGQGAWINSISGSLTQAHKALLPSAAGNHAVGLTFYSYAATNKDGLPNSEFYHALSQPSGYGSPPFPTWEPPPSLSWKASPTRGHLLGWAIAPTGPLARVQVFLSGPENRTLLTDGNGCFGAVDLLPGSYTVTLPSPATSPLYATVSAGKVALAGPGAPPAEPAVRALLVDAAHDGFKTPDQVDTLLADARAAHLNALIVQVRDHGAVYYRSDLEPRSTDPELEPGFDPLAYLLEGAHGRSPRLDVYAWIPILPVWNQDAPPSDPRHPFNLHPEWLTQDVTGNLRSYGDYFFDPGHPEVAGYTQSLLVELLGRYPVDGLFLDGLHYPQQGSTIGNAIWGYNPTAVLRFREQYGYPGAPAPGDPLWMEWRREQLSALVRRLYLAATAVRRALRIAVAAVAWGDGPDASGGWEQSQAYARVLQDWRAWLEEGIVDLAAPRNFDREYRSEQRAWYDHWLAWEANHLYERGIIVLQGAYLNYPEHTLDQAQQALGVSKGVGFASYIPANLYADPNGNVSNPPRQPWFYSPEGEWWLWRMLALPYGYTDPATGLFTATTPLFPGDVAPPALPWKDTPARGHAWGRALGPGGVALDGVTVTLVLTPSGTLVGHLRTDGQGYFGGVDLEPGAYEARVADAAAPYAVQRASVKAGRVAWFMPSFPERLFLPRVLWAD